MSARARGLLPWDLDWKSGCVLPPRCRSGLSMGQARGVVALCMGRGLAGSRHGGDPPEPRTPRPQTSAPDTKRAS